jgi:1,4-dihydroxy-2-naphthoate octaprenyltransferase
VLPFGTLLVVLSFPIARTVWRAFGRPKPAESPMPNPVWPLWFAPHAFILTRRAGGLLVLGMIIGVIVGH